MNEPTPATGNEVYALCYCDYFRFSDLRNQLQQHHRCETYRDALSVDWGPGHVYLFDYGVVVFWRLSPDERQEVLSGIADHAHAPLSVTLDDVFTYETGSDKPFIKNDHINLPDNDTLTELAVSHGIAQSTKLAQFENHVLKTISSTEHIPENIARTGSAGLSRRKIAQLRGRLFLTTSDIMLNYALLDVPDFFWEYPELDGYYVKVSDYLEIRQRVTVLTKKLETIHQLFDMMADEQKHKHSAMLEWIIIWLIAFEIIVFMFHDVLDWI